MMLMKYVFQAVKRNEFSVPENNLSAAWAALTGNPALTGRARPGETPGLGV